MGRSADLTPRKGTKWPASSDRPPRSTTLRPDLDNGCHRTEDGTGAHERDGPDGSTSAEIESETDRSLDQRTVLAQAHAAREALRNSRAPGPLGETANQGNER